MYLIKSEDRGHFSHKRGKGHGDLVNNCYSLSNEDISALTKQRPAS